MNYDKVVGDVHISISSYRIDKNIERAQDMLDMQVLADSNQYVPFQQGALKGSGHVVKAGEIEWNTPYAHYQYMGEVYGPSYPIRDKSGNIVGWVSPPHKYPTGRDLQYHTPNTGAFWFEEAKETHKNSWIDIVRREIDK